jgi:hypothetical protein
MAFLHPTINIFSIGFPFSRFIVKQRFAAADILFPFLDCKPYASLTMKKGMSLIIHD